MAEDIQLFFNVLLAAALSGLIGWERESRDMPAGFRTNMIVGSAAALLVVLGYQMIDFYDALDTSDSDLRFDPLRVIEAIIVGVSFIGAGTILKMEKEGRIRYLTSAATILISAAVGITVALQHYTLAVLVTGLILLINYVIRKWEARTGKPEQ